MMTKNEFTKWCSKLDLTNSAVELINRVRESEPSRQVGGGRKNVIGAYPSRKMGRCIHFESHKVELPGLYIKEYNDDVLEMYDQPPAIKISFKSLKEKVVTIYHTPDYFVLFKDRAGWEEWKTEEELYKIAEDSPNRYVLIDGVWRCPAGEKYAKQFGLYYWVKCSKDINWELQRNIVFLEDYILDVKTEFSPQILDKVLLLVRNNPGILLTDVLKTSDVQADEIYYMIARKIIYVDLDRETLGQPEFTHIYIDEQTAIAYNNLYSRIKNVPKFNDFTLKVAPGVKVVWDGKCWIIANLGEKEISLSTDKMLIDIPIEQFYNMVYQKKIKCAETEKIKEINCAINSIITGASEQEIEEANNRYKIILLILEGSKVENISAIGVTSRTIRNWLNSYKRAEQQYGSGFIGLIPCIKKRGNRFPHLPDDTLKAVNEFLNENETVTNQSNKVLYGKFCNSCKKSGIIPPSIKSFNKIISSRSKHERILKTQGSRVAYQQEKFYWELNMTTPRHGERPFEIAHIDHTEIDLQLVHSRTGKKLGKAWLTIMMDAYSRRVLSFYITFDAPSYRSNMMAIRECVRRFNRLPQIIVMDNGRDFKSTYFQSLLSYCAVTYKIRPPHKCRFGSVGERLFGTTMSQLIHNLKGNTKIMKNVRQVTKSVNPINYAIWTLPEIYKLLKDYFYEFYDTHEHSALGESPRDVFLREIAISGKRPFRFIPYNKDFYIMTLPAIKRNNGTAKVDPQRGVKVNYFYYYCQEFYKTNVSGTRVQVRYDPWDMSVVYCYVCGQWVMCYSQYYSQLKRRTENEMKIASQELLKQKKTNAGRYNLSARELADFIMRAEQTEELLNQRYRDADITPELKVINDSINTNSIKKCTVNYKPDFDINEKINFDLDDE